MPTSDWHMDQDAAHGWDEKAGMMGLAYRKEVEVHHSRIHCKRTACANHFVTRNWKINLLSSKFPFKKQGAFKTKKEKHLLQQMRTVVLVRHFISSRIWLP